MPFSHDRPAGASVPGVFPIVSTGAAWYSALTLRMEYTMSTVGEILKKKRLENNLELAELSEATKISINFLRAIENNEFKRLPKGIFPKMFIRAYAKQVGLDENKIVQLFYEQIALSDVTIVESPPPPSRDDRSQRARYVLQFLAILLVVGALAVTVYIFYHRPETKDPASGVTPDDPEAEVKRRSKLPTLPGAGGPSAGMDPAAPTGTPPVSDLAPGPEPGSGPVLPPPPAAPDQKLKLVLVAREYCWIHLTYDKFSEKDFILNPNDTFSQEFIGEVILKLGNAGGVHLTINDLPARPLGQRGQVVSLSLTPENFQSYLAQAEVP